MSAIQAAEEDVDNTEEGTYEPTMTRDVSHKRIHDLSRQSERVDGRLYISVDGGPDELQVRKLTHSIMSPAVLPKVPLDALFREGQEGTILPPTIYSCNLSPKQAPESPSGVSEKHRGQPSPRSNTASASRKHQSLEMKSKNSHARVNNVVKMLQGTRPSPRRKSAGGTRFQAVDSSSEEENRIDFLQLTKKKQPHGRKYPEMKKYRQLKQQIQDLQEANKTQVQQLQNQKVSLQRRGIMSKEFKIPDYSDPQSRQMNNTQRQEEHVRLPSIDTQKVRPPRKQPSLQKIAQNVDGSRKKGATANLAAVKAPALRNTRRLITVTDERPQQSHPKFSDEGAKARSTTNQEYLEVNANDKFVPESSQNVASHQSQKDIHRQSKATEVTNMKKSLSNVQIRNKEDRSNAGSRLYDLSLSSTINLLIQMKNQDKKVRKRTTSNLDAEIANETLKSNSLSDLRQLYHQEQKIASKNSKAQVLLTRRQPKGRKVSKKKVAKYLTKKSDALHDSKANLHASIKKSYLSQVHKDFQQNIITADLTRNSSKNAIKVNQKGAVSPWAQAERSFDNNTEMLGTVSSKQDLKSGRHDKSKSKERKDTKERKVEQSKGISPDDHVKILNTNQSSERWRRSRRQAKNEDPKQKLSLQKGRFVIPAPFQHVDKYKSGNDAPHYDVCTPKLPNQMSQTTCPSPDKNNDSVSQYKVKKFNNDIRHVSRQFDYSSALATDHSDQDHQILQPLRQTQIKTEMHTHNLEKKRKHKPSQLAPLNHKYSQEDPTEAARWQQNCATTHNTSKRVSPDNNDALNCHYDNTFNITSGQASKHLNHDQQEEELGLAEDAMISKLKLYSQIKAQQLSALKKDQRNMQIIKRQAKKAEQRRIFHQQNPHHSFDLNFTRQIYDQGSAMNVRRGNNPLFGMSTNFNSSSTSQSVAWNNTRDHGNDAQRRLMSKTVTNHKGTTSQRKDKQSLGKLATPIECNEAPDCNNKKKARRLKKKSEREAMNSSGLTHISSVTQIPQGRSGRASRKQLLNSQPLRDESLGYLHTAPKKTGDTSSPQPPMQYLRENVDVMREWKGKSNAFEDLRKAKNRKHKKQMNKLNNSVNFDLSMPKENFKAFQVASRPDVIHIGAVHDPVQHYHGQLRDKKYASGMSVAPSRSEKKKQNKL